MLLTKDGTQAMTTPTGLFWLPGGIASQTHGGRKRGYQTERPSHRHHAQGRVTGRGVSLEGDHVCVAMERAITQQPADRGGINVVGASDIRDRAGL